MIQDKDAGVTEETLPSPARRGNRGLLVILALVLVAGLAGWRGWVAWQAREIQAQAQVDDAEQRVIALEQRLEALRRDQRAQTQRIQDAAATNRVLRDYPFCNGMKTGYTQASGKCLISSASKDGRDCIVVVIGSSSVQIWKESRALLDWSLNLDIQS